jgi:hypothetical protein
MKVLSVLLVALLCFAGVAFAQEGLTTKVEAVPQVFQVTPATNATLAASRWMQFSNCAGEGACCATLAAKSLQYINGAPNFTEVPGLSIEVPIDPAYRTSGSILVTWTMRVEGENNGGLINPWQTLCDVWHGSVTETFKGGQVYSQAYVDLGDGFKPAGQISSMTVPDGGSGVSVNVNDPTHSGSYLLKPGANGFPAKVKIKVYWKNDTSLKLISQSKYRSLIVTVLPTGQ